MTSSRAPEFGVDRRLGGRLGVALTAAYTTSAPLSRTFERIHTAEVRVQYEQPTNPACWILEVDRLIMSAPQR